MSLLYLGIGRSLFVAPHLDSPSHRHSTIEIKIALDHPFSYRTERSPWAKTRALVLNSNVPHALRDLQGMQATLHVVPEKHRAIHLRTHFLRGAKARTIDTLDLAPYVSFFRNSLTREHDCTTAFSVCERLIDDLTGVRGFKEELDERLLVVMEYIQENLSNRICSKTLARMIFLSEDRFLHVFKEQLGLPLRQYILYQRILRASLAILNGSSLTQAALEAGFSDSSHYTRTFVRLNGIRPSQIKQFRTTTRIYACSSARCLRPWFTSGCDTDGTCPNCTLFHDAPQAPVSTSLKWQK